MTASTRLVVVDLQTLHAHACLCPGVREASYSEFDSTRPRAMEFRAKSKEPSKGWLSPLRIGYPQERQLW